MSIGQAFEDADGLLTLLALLPVMFGMLVFANNIDNPNFDGIEALNTLLTNLAHALVPSIGAILIVGLTLWAVRNSSGR